MEKGKPYSCMKKLFPKESLLESINKTKRVANFLIRSSGTWRTFSKDKSFLNLEYLVLDEKTEILCAPLLSELLRKLKVIGFATSHPKSDYFFENLQNIEQLRVLSAPWKELIVHDHQGSSSGETHEVKTLPRVKALGLGNMPELIHLGKENSQPRGPVFPNLEFLRLEKCGKLENLASTLISFWNLTTLTIVDCHGLHYLIPYSVAKNLQQLKKLVVKSCERMIEIVASNEDDPENEITFSCLKHLELSGLPSLQGFCTGNCIFKVPSVLSKNLIVEDCQLIELKISPDGLLQSDPRPERLQITEETDDVLKLSDSKENDHDQTNQLMIADTNLDVTTATLSTKEESSFFGWHVKFFRVCVIVVCVLYSSSFCFSFSRKKYHPGEQTGRLSDLLDHTTHSPEITLVCPNFLDGDNYAT